MTPDWPEPAAGTTSVLSTERGVEAVVGLDIGTTTSKALIRPLGAQHPILVVDAHTVWTTTAAGGTEARTETLLDTAIDVLTRVVGVARAAWGRVAVRAISVTGLAESGVLLDPAGRPVLPAISWFDPRGQRDLDLVAGRHPNLAAGYAAVTGLPYSAQASFAKLLWMCRHADLCADGSTEIPAGYRWLSVPEWIVHALGGAQVREPSLASRTGLIEQSSGQPWGAALDVMGASADLLPPAAPAGTAVGTLAHPGVPSAAQGAVLSVAGHDHPVAALAVGAAGIDELFNSTGTADVLARAVAGPLQDRQRAAIVAAGWSAGAHVIPGVDLLLAGGSGGLLLRRVLAALGADGPEARQRLDELSEQVRELPAGLLVSGDSRRGLDVQIRLRDGATPAAVWRAATIATAGLAREMLDDIEALVGPHRRAVAAGGWTRMASVCRAKAAAIPALEINSLDQPGASGAALLAEYSLDGGVVSLSQFLNQNAPSLGA